MDSEASGSDDGWVFKMSSQAMIDIADDNEGVTSPVPRSPAPGKCPKAVDEIPQCVNFKHLLDYSFVRTILSFSC